MLNFIRKLLSKLYRKLGISADLGYIGTGVSLPPPLSKEEELRLTLLFTNADDSPAARETAEQAKNTLIEHNLRLVVYIAKKFENTGVCIEDLISIGTIGLIKAVNTFRADRNIKLATYASRCIENEILMHLRKTVKQKLDKNQLDLNKRQKSIHTSFSGKLFCGDCGCVYKKRSHSSEPTWVCSKDGIAGRRCTTHPINEISLMIAFVLMYNLLQQH